MPEVRRPGCPPSTTAPTTSSWTCACERHGFWLDEGEAVRVRELVEERVEGLERAVKAEAEWGNFIDDLRDEPVLLGSPHRQGLSATFSRRAIKRETRLSAGLVIR